MKTHQFTLILGGVSEWSAELADRLYEATNGDIEFNIRNGVAYLEFDRQAQTLREAILSAIREVEDLGISVRVLCQDQS